MTPQYEPSDVCIAVFLAHQYSLMQASVGFIKLRLVNKWGANSAWKATTLQKLRVQ